MLFGGTSLTIPSARAYMGGRSQWHSIGYPVKCHVHPWMCEIILWVSIQKYSLLSLLSSHILLRDFILLYSVGSWCTTGIKGTNLYYWKGSSVSVRYYILYLHQVFIKQYRIKNIKCTRTCLKLRLAFTIVLFSLYYTCFYEHLTHPNTHGPQFSSRHSRTDFVCNPKEEV